MRSIFISYRREDAEGQAGRLFDDLTAKFGKDSVFMDVVDIEPGRDFRRVIDQHVASCAVLLAVIGKGWLEAKDQAGRRRIDNPNDFVRLETASALKRDIPVIPVLVQGAGMPLPEQLPDDLKELAFRNAVEITHARWDSDTQLLINALGRYIQAEKQHEEGAVAKVGADAKPATAEGTGALRESPETGAGPTGSTATPRPRRISRFATLIISAVALAVISGGYLIYVNYQKAAEEQRIAAEKLAAERSRAEKAAEEQRIAAEKLAAERAQAEKAAQQRAAQERLLQEQKAKEAAQKAEKERAQVAAQRAREDAAQKRSADKTASAVAPSPSGFRVIEVFVRADPAEYKGRCPGKINFFARVSAVGGKGRVSYRWLRSDGASAPVQSLVLEGPGSKDLNTTWTLGGPGRQYSEWQALKILEPQEIESQKASFRIQCDSPLSADIAAVKILSASCTAVGSGLYKVEMHGEASGPNGAYFSAGASPYQPGKSTFTTTCDQWSVLTVGLYPRCQRKGSQPFKTTWKSTHTLYTPNRAPYSADALVFDDTAGSGADFRPLVRDDLRLSCN